MGNAPTCPRHDGGTADARPRVVRLMAALSVCALALAGCDTLNESAKSFNESVGEVDSLLFGEDAPEASEGGAEPVTSEPGEELAVLELFDRVFGGA